MQSFLAPTGRWRAGRSQECDKVEPGDVGRRPPTMEWMECACFLSMELMTRANGRSGEPSSSSGFITADLNYAWRTTAVAPEEERSHRRLICVHVGVAVVSGG